MPAYLMKKTCNTAMFPFEAEDAAVLLGQKIRLARRIRETTQQDLAESIEISLNTVVKMEAGHPGVQLGFYLKAMWALDIIHDFTANLSKVGMTEAEFVLMAGNLPKTVRKRKMR